MSERETGIPGTQTLMDEHADLLAELRKLELATGRDRGSETWLETLRPILRGIRDGLQSHFAGEEQSDFYQALPIEQPRFARRLAELADEHGLILRIVGDVVELAGELEGASPEARTAFADRVGRFITLVRDHEGAENEILAQSVWEDLGRGA